jgi:hypothetical protein
MLFPSRTFSDERAFLELQRRLALCANHLPDPPVETTSNLLAPLIKPSAVAALAALIAAILVGLPGTRESPNKVKQSVNLSVLIAKKVESAETQSAPGAQPSLIPASEVALRGTPNSKPKPALAAGNPTTSEPTSDSRTSTVTAGPALATMATSEAAQITNDEIMMLLKLGKNFFQSGDLVSARLLFRRAATAGNAEAAFALGRTFDPMIADRMGIIGIKPAIARARQWYESAAELGWPAAQRELARLQRCL